MKHWLNTAAIAAIMIGSGAAYAADTPGTNKASTVGANAGGVTCNQDLAVVDTNDDGSISTDEAVTASLKEFDRIDVDNSGTLSKSEWEHCNEQALLNSEMTTATVNTGAGTDNGMKKNDSAMNNDKGADKTSDMAKSKAENTAPFAGKNPFETDEDFSAADSDKDNQLTRDEAAKAAESAYNAGSNEGKNREDFARSYGARFAMIDKNGDGTVSQEEWQGRDSATIQSAFAKLDEDNNGELSKSEYQEARKAQSSDTDGKPVSVWYYFVF